MKTIVFTTSAADQLLSLPQGAQDAIEQALDDYAIAGSGNVVALRNSAYRRLRVGRYRVIFGEDAVTVLAVYVGKRETTTYKKGRVK